MRKLKFNLGEGGVKGFLVRHVEKMVMLGAVVLVGVFFCLGYFAPGLAPDKTPVALKAKLNQVRGYMTRDTWAILEKFRTPDLRHPERVDEGRKTTDDGSYRLPEPLAAPQIRQRTLRTDPKLYPPTK